MGRYALNALGKNPARIERLRLKDRRYAEKAQRSKNPDKIERLRFEGRVDLLARQRHGRSVAWPPRVLTTGSSREQSWGGTGFSLFGTI